MNRMKEYSSDFPAEKKWEMNLQSQSGSHDDIRPSKLVFVISNVMAWLIIGGFGAFVVYLSLVLMNHDRNCVFAWTYFSIFMAICAAGLAESVRRKLNEGEKG